MPRGVLGRLGSMPRCMGKGKGKGRAIYYDNKLLCNRLPCVMGKICILSRTMYVGDAHWLM